MQQLSYAEAAKRVGKTEKSIANWRRSGMPMGCLIKLAILALVGFGIYTGVNWAMAKINGIHHDLNNWVSKEWHQIAQKINLEKNKLPDKIKPSIDVPTEAPNIPGVSRTP